MTPIQNKYARSPSGNACCRLVGRSLPLALTALMLAMTGCALQPAYVMPDLPMPESWSVAPSQPGEYTDLHEHAWWRELGDMAIDNLIEAAIADNPSLQEAATRIDEARATLRVSAASRAPAVDGNVSISRAKGLNNSQPSAGERILSTSTAAGPTLSWELDLFGRLRYSIEAARSRLDARTADAASTRLALAAEVADGVLSLRACENTRGVYLQDIASREKTLALTRLRINAGSAAPVDDARAVAGLSTSRASLASQQEQCTRQVNALVALSGRDAATVRTMVGVVDRAAHAAAIFMPQPPVSAPNLPATVLTQHPDVISAEREVSATWAEIGAARANRLPRINLAAALTGQWIRAAGSQLDTTGWSIGPSVTGPLFDGGAGAANVRAADARYRRAVAALDSTLRTTVQDVENALAAQASAASRLASTQAGVRAAGLTLQASEAQWKLGAVSLFELEDTRRQFASAQDAEISARRDQAQAWVALVKATGGAMVFTSDIASHD